MSPGAPPPVLFGKLPDRADFVHQGTGSPAVEALDAVIQKALWPRLPARDGPLYRIVYHPPRGPHLLAGALQLSRDRVGRLYPLLVGRPVDHTALDASVAPTWPLRWAPLFDLSAEIVRRAAGGHARVADAVAWTTDLPLPEPAAGVDDALRRLAARPASVLWTHPGAVGPTPTVLALHRLAGLRPSVLPAHGLRIALPRTTEHGASAEAVAFWLAAAARLSGGRFPPPTVFWTDGTSSPEASLTIAFGALAPRTLRALLVGATDPEAVAALDRGTAGELDRAIQRLPRPLLDHLAAGDATVGDLLARLPGPA